MLLNARAIDDSIANDLAHPVDQPPPSFSMWSFLKAGGKGLPGGALESTGSVADLLSGTGFDTALASLDNSPQAAEASKQMRESQRNFVLGTELRRGADSFAPDPNASTTADQVIHGLVKNVGKAVTDIAIAGPAGGALLFGGGEADDAAQRLIAKGVDTKTAVGVGAVTGVVQGIGAALPIAGTTVLKTLGLVAAAGPGSYVAQEGLSREILQRAGYADEAKQHDPTDPLGLALSIAVPGVFGAAHMRAAGRRTVADVVQHIESGGQRFGADGKLLTSSKGAQGEMQVMPGTSADPGFGVTPARDGSPDELARVGRDYLAAMQKRYGRDDQALAAYNAGPGTVDAAIKAHGEDWLAHMPDETKAYVAKAEKLTHEAAATRGADDPATVDAARVRVLNDHMAEVLPEGVHDAMPQVLRAADALGEGRMPETAPEVRGVDPVVPPELLDGQPSTEAPARPPSVLDSPTAPRETNALPPARQVGIEAEAAAVSPATPKATGLPSPELQRATALAEENPGLRVRLPGSEETVSIADALRRAGEAHDSDAGHASLVEAAWQCAMSFGASA